MAKQTLPDFAPELRVVAAGNASNRLVVVFDTATDLDLKRSPRVVMIDTEGVTNITTEVTDVSTQELVDRALYQGKINLLTQKGEAEATRYLLAEFSLEVEGHGKRSKEGKLNFPPALEVEQQVLQGVADAFTEASLEMVYSSGAGAAPTTAAYEQAPAGSPWLARPALAYAGGPAAPTGSARSSGGKKGWSKKATWFVALLALLLLAATLKIMLSSSDPVQSAVNKALANDPRARDEQIEITRNTLREMGLDPGKNGDLGCLAAP